MRSKADRMKARVRKAPGPHIASYLHHLEATGGGTLRYIEYLAEIRSPEIAFLLFDRNEVDLCRFARMSNIRIRRVPLWFPVRVVAVLWQTVVYLKKHRPRVVHAHSSISGLVVRLLRPFFGYRVIYTPHCYSFTYPNGLVKNAMYRLVEKALAHLGATTNLHVSVSDYLIGKQLSIRNPGVVIHSPFDWRKQPVDFRRTFDSNTVLLLGSDRPQKGYRILDRVAREFQGMSPAMRILVVGALPFSHKVRCVPWQEDLDQFYANAFCMLNVSFSEGLSLSLIDALYVGLPVVAFDIPANRELLDNGCGVLVEQRNAGDIAAAIFSLKQNFERYQMLHQNGQQRALAHFSPKLFYRAYIRHYQQYGIADVAIPEISSQDSRQNELKSLRPGHCSNPLPIF